MTENPVSPEAGAWDSVRPGWHQLYGSFKTLGLSVETHDFRAAEGLDWGRSFHPESLELCLNLSGGGDLTHGKQRAAYRGRTAGYYVVREENIDARRRPRERHRFITVELSRAWLAGRVGELELMAAPARGLITGGRESARLGPVQPLSIALETVALGLAQPPVAAAARALWYESKALELIAQLMFARESGSELFCHRQKRIARERIDGVMIILRERMQEPPGLDELAKAVGCSPFYLSRTFSQETGMTILQYLRKIRMEQAAELLLSGSYNVTEAAMEVGYSSLSHFSKSFCEVIGCCPALFPQARELVRRFRGGV